MAQTYPSDYPENYKIDNQRGELLSIIYKDQTAFDNVASTKYTQLNFPYTPEYITKLEIGTNGKTPLGGTELVGMHTKDSCAMNAALVYNKNNSISLGTTFIDDISCRIKRGEQLISDKLYSSVNKSLLLAATTTAPVTTAPTSEPTITPVTTAPTTAPEPYRVQLSGFFLPEDGDKNGRIELASGYPVNGYKTLGIWIGIKPETCTQRNAVVYYENGTSKTDNFVANANFLILKNTALSFVIKYTFYSEELVRFYPETEGIKIPFVIKSKTKQIGYKIKTIENIENTGNLVYYNLERKNASDSMGKCIIYNGKTLDDTNKKIIESSENYETQSPKQIASYQLSYSPTEKVEFVGLNENGTLCAYYTDATPNLKSRPVKDNKDVAIEAKNKGKNGINKTSKYTMVLDDSVRETKPSSRYFFMFPIENIDRSRLSKNTDWEKVENHYLKTIDNSNQKVDRGIKQPSMKITMDFPLYSNGYKLKMIVEKNTDDQFYYLRVYGTFKNNNTIFSIVPDFKMGQMFVADENAGVNKMYIVKDENKILDKLDSNGKLVYSVNDYRNYYPPPDYNEKESEYSVFNRERDGYCKEQAKGKSHFFVIEKKGKTQCVVPKNMDREVVFIPKQSETNISKSTLYVPNKSVTSGNTETDKNLGIGKYNI